MRTSINVMRLGIIGFGEMGKRIGKDLVECADGGIEIAGVVEPEDESYEDGCSWIASRPARFDSVQEMLDAITPHGVAVASPNHKHLENLHAIGKQEFPIWLEKPLDSTYEKICGVLRFSEEYPGKIMVDHVMRYSPIIAKAKTLLDDGTIGQLCSANFVQNCFYGNGMDHNFRRTREGGGGMLIEKATHDFDIMMYLLESKPTQVSSILKMQAFGGTRDNVLRCRACDEKNVCKESVARIQEREGLEHGREKLSRQDLCVFADEIDVSDNQVCIIEFENGCFGTYADCYFSPSSYSTREYEVVGLEGIMRISLSLAENHDHGRISVHQRYGTADDVQTYDFEYEGRIHYKGGPVSASHFYEIMQGQAEPFTPVDEAFAAVTLGHAATVAGTEKRYVFVADIVPGDLKPKWEAIWNPT